MTPGSGRAGRPRAGGRGSSCVPQIKEQYERTEQKETDGRTDAFLLLLYNNDWLIFVLYNTYRVVQQARAFSDHPVMYSRNSGAHSGRHSLHRDYVIIRPT